MSFLTPAERLALIESTQPPSQHTGVKSSGGLSNELLTSTLTQTATSMLRVNQKILTSVMKRRANVLVIGSTQYGKSTASLLQHAGPAIENGNVAVVILDGHGSYAESVALHALAKGQGFRLVFVDLNDIHHVFSFGFAERPSRSLSRRDFRQQASEQARQLSEIMVSQRGREYGPIDGKVLVKEWATFAILFWMHQPEDLPLSWMPWGLKPGTEQFDHMLNNCTDPEVREKAFLLARMMKNTNEMYKTVGPAMRLLDELFSDEAFRSYAEATVDLETALKNKIIVCFKGGTSPGVTRVLLRSVWQRIVGVLKRNWMLTQTPIPVVIHADEAAELIGEPEARSLAECLKMMTHPETNEGGCVIISQTPDFGDDRTNMLVSQNCTRKEFFHSGGLVAPLAAAELKAGIDPNRIRRTKTKMEHTGEFSAEHTISYGKSKDQEGHEREDKREGVSYLPVYRRVEDEELWSLNDQVLLAEIALQGLGVGECWVRDGADIYFKRIQKPRNPWTFAGLGKKYLEAHMENQRTQGVFRKVEDTEPMVVDSETILPMPSRESAPPKAKDKKPPKGMR